MVEPEEPKKIANTPTGQRVQGNWMQFKGKLREKWGDLTDDSLDRYQGKREQLIGHIVAEQGAARQEVEKEIDRYSRDAEYRFE